MLGVGTSLSVMCYHGHGPRPRKEKPHVATTKGRRGTEDPGRNKLEKNPSVGCMLADGRMHIWWWQFSKKKNIWWWCQPAPCTNHGDVTPQPNLPPLSGGRGPLYLARCLGLRNTNSVRSSQPMQWGAYENACYIPSDQASSFPARVQLIDGRW